MAMLHNRIMEAAREASKEINESVGESGMTGEEQELVIDDTAELIYNHMVKLLTPSHESLVIIDWTEHKIKT